MAKDQAEKELQRLRKLPENRICPNCSRKDTLFGFSAICVPFRTFICSECKSAHQAFSHRCKSVSMSNWTMDEVRQLEEKHGGGNQIAFERWVARSPESMRPGPGSSQDALKNFIDKAYNQKAWEAPAGGNHNSRSRNNDDDDVRGGKETPPLPSTRRATSSPNGNAAPPPLAPPNGIARAATAPPPVANLLDMFDEPAPVQAATQPVVPQPQLQQPLQAQWAPQPQLQQPTQAQWAPQVQAAAPAAAAPAPALGGFDFDPFAPPAAAAPAPVAAAPAPAPAVAAAPTGQMQPQVPAASMAAFGLASALAGALSQSQGAAAAGSLLGASALAGGLNHGVVPQVAQPMQVQAFEMSGAGHFGMGMGGMQAQPSSYSMGMGMGWPQQPQQQLQQQPQQTYNQQAVAQPMPMFAAGPPYNQCAYAAATALPYQSCAPGMQHAGMQFGGHPAAQQWAPTAPMGRGSAAAVAACGLGSFDPFASG